MKTHRLVILLAALSLSAGAVFTLLTAGDRAVMPTPVTVTTTAVTTTATTDAAADGYTLGAWNGRLAVFRQDNPYPDEVFDVFIRSFPAEDRRLLEQGIPAADEVVLEQLLEDYTS